MAEKDDEFKPEQLETVSTMATSLHSSHLEVLLSGIVAHKQIDDVYAVLSSLPSCPTPL